MSLRMVLLLLFLLLLLLCCCRSCCSHGCPLSIGTRGEEASTSSRGVAIRSSESGHRSLRAGAPKTRRELRSGTPGWTRGPGCSGRCQPPTHRGTQAARAHEGVPMYSASVFLRILVPMSRMITFLSLRLLLLSAASPEIDLPIPGAVVMDRCSPWKTEGRASGSVCASPLSHQWLRWPRTRGERAAKGSGGPVLSRAAREGTRKTQSPTCRQVVCAGEKRFTSLEHTQSL
ncbi:unnamed protein product [Prorocentrum cordatum]|uniref:Secreted protein n=1 Tax=Prorocentrum cordatum TaxID=2364126 RepID=A0ABN9XCT6_9DINO|nr:unnamed protein product [Polarella glacialis]